MLAVHSRRAYELWIARDEPQALAEARRMSGTSASVVIQPVIDCRDGWDGLEDTLDSLGEAGFSAPPVLISGPSVSDTISIRDPQALAGIIESDKAWVCPLGPGDRLNAGAFLVYAGAAADSPNPSLVYADDDLMGADGRRRSPHFKPDWNPDLFEHHDFISGAAIISVSREALQRLPGRGWVEALVEAAIERKAPVHVPLVLHHRRARPGPVVPTKPAVSLPDPLPTVSAIIPTRDHAALLRSCIEGLKRTAYPNLETIVIDNGSQEPDALEYLETLERGGTVVLRMPGPFNFSALNNAAVAQASGRILCFLNNDVEMVDSDWLSLMVRQSLRPDLGAVGARLLYPDGTVQHAGVLVGIGGAAGHGHRLQRADEPGYFERARLPQRVSGVTAACLVVDREKFLAVGGFDEQDFAVAFNDIDLCLKLGARGWASFYEPRATLIHHESKSRGSDRAKTNRARFAAELAALKRKWHTDERRDPYHHPQLSLFCEQFLISI